MSSARRARRPVGAAFFDVDETLISLKSMQSFLDYYFEGESDSDATAWQRFAQTMEGVSREEGNRAYYRLWKGQRLDDVQRAGDAWFEQQAGRPGFFVDVTLAAVREHTAAGRLVLLVSGSFSPCLRALGRHVGATEVLCTQLAHVDGVLTGEVLRSAIGEDKRVAVAEAIRRYGISRDQTWGYGDHHSDIPLLEEVAHAITVNPGTELEALARARGWAVIGGETASAGG